MKVLTFGEVMLRLKTPEHLKILQADTFEANYGGAEANVAVSLADTRGRCFVRDKSAGAPGGTGSRQ